MDICPNCGYYCTGKSVFCTPPIKNSRSSEESELSNEEKWHAKRIESEYSDHSKAMFRQFVKMYHEIVMMGVDPDMLYRIFNKERK